MQHHLLDVIIRNTASATTSVAAPSVHNHLLTLIVRHGVPLAALMIFGGELGLPTGVPMEVALLLVGGYSIHSLPALLGGLVLVVGADLLGTMLLFLAMRTGGARLLDRLVGGHMERGRAVMERWRERLGGHDVAAIGVGRSIPLVRMYVPVGAGLMRLPTERFLLGALIGSLVWAGSPLVAGYLLRARVQTFADRYSRFSHLLFAVLLAAAVLALGIWWVNQSSTARGRLLRVRSALGLAVAIAAAVYLVETAWAEDVAARQGHAILPLLIFWLGLLGVAVAALISAAVRDVRAARLAHQEDGTPLGWAAAELASTLTWAALIVVLGAIILWLERHYAL